MRRIFGFAILLSLLPISLYAQCDGYLTAAAGQAAFSSSAALDAGNNLYSVGTFDSIFFMDGATLKAAPSSSGLFLAQLTSGGRISFAEKIAEAPSGSISQVAVTRTGDALIIVGCAGNILSITDSSIQIPAPANRSILVVKTDLTGTMIWNKVFFYLDTSNSGAHAAITSDSGGGAYITTTFHDTLALSDNIKLVSTHPTETPAALFHISSSGDIEWAVRSDISDGHTTVLPLALTRAPNKFLIMSGCYSDSISFGGIARGRTQPGSAELVPFLAGFDEGGFAHWITVASNFSSTTNSSSSYFAANATSPDGFVYTTGLLMDSIHLAGTTIHADGSSFLAKFSDIDGTLEWFHPNHGYVSTNGVPQTGTGVAVDRFGSVYTTEEFYDSLYIGDIRVAATGNSATLIRHFDNTGKPIGYTVGNAPLGAIAYSPLIDAADSLVLITRFSGPEFSTSQATVNLPLTGNAINGIAYWKLCELAPAAVEISYNTTPENSPTLTIFPNPAHQYINFTLTGVHKTHATAHIYNIIGETIWTGQLDISITGTTLKLPNLATHSGTYFLNLIIEDKSITQKTLSQKFSVQ